MKDLFIKFLPAIIAGLTVVFIPIKNELLFVGFLVLVDWLTGMSVGIKQGTFDSSQAIRKFWVSFGYFLGILVARAVEMYWGSDLIVKSVVAIIAISEIQSLRENVEKLTGIDILKPVINTFKKKNNVH